MQDREFLAIYLEEAAELLARWEHICLTMENSPSESSMNALFGTVNTLKEGCLSVGLGEMGLFMKQIEDGILFLKKNPEFAKPAVFAIVLDCHSCLINWFRNLKSNPNFVDPEAVHHQKRLQAAISTPNRTAHIPSSAAVEKIETKQPDLKIEIMEPKADELAVQTVKSVSAPIEPERTQPVQGPVTEKTSIVKIVDVDKDSSVVSPEIKTKAGKQTNLQRAAAPANSIRVNLDKIDQLIRMIRDISIQHTMITQASVCDEIKNPITKEAINSTAEILRDLQKQALSLKTKSATSLLIRVENEARDTAKSQSKRVKIKTTGDQFEIDREVLDDAKILLVQLTCNIVDLCIESELARKTSRKPPVANLLFEIIPSANFVRFRVSHDGQGISPMDVRDIAIKNQLITADKFSTAEEALKLLCVPHISKETKSDEADARDSELLSVVDMLRKLNAKLTINNSHKNGPTFVMEIPCKAPMIDAIIVSIADHYYAVPITDVREVVDLSTYVADLSDKKPLTINLRGESLPLLHLESLEDFSPGKASNSRLAIIASQSDSNVAFMIDKIVGQQTVVYQQFDPDVKSTPGYTGTTVLTNGHPAIIVEPSLIPITRLKRAS
jgi:two-component system chemotaxis sensor kinase CheA